MTIKDLYDKLNELGIDPSQYYLHGLYGSSDDSDKPALTIRRVIFVNLYITYFKEKGEIHSERTMITEDEACRYFLKQFISEVIFDHISSVNDIRGISIKETLSLTGLNKIYNHSIKGDKILSTLILEKLSEWQR